MVGTGAVRASSLPLPTSNPSTATVSSLLYDPTSHSLALLHSDSSVSLHPDATRLLPPNSLLPPPQALVPPPVSSSAFVSLLDNPHPDASSPPRTIFVSSHPHRGGSQIVFRLLLLKSGKFVRARVVCKQKDLNFDCRLGVLFDRSHGVSLRICGSVNYFAVYSVSCSRVWVFGLRMLKARDGASDGDDNGVKLMRCAVIELCRPVSCMSLSFGLLVLGEENGLRVFNLIGVLKGAAKKAKSDGLKLKGGRRSPNGVRNGFVEGKNDRPLEKQRSVKLKQDCSDGNSYFVTLERRDCKDLESTSKRMFSLKATSIQSLCPKTFIVCDSLGELHLLRLAKSNVASGVINLKLIPHIMKVQHLATFPDTSTGPRSFWIGDGSQSLHMVVESDSEAVLLEDGDNNVNPLHVSVVQAIFTCEKIQGAVAFASNGILILGEGSIGTLSRVSLHRN
ncbi:hypothetical protein MLD38_024556 [Melastoma candidum]|uniref:Uncharacterized protein n=1 Tax=Melastoma candidum TaxID=119954 RepID=A0ACB9NW31_9MYRT|nr:hypothetical protein MLD38_024556 [Melastoma candidum]